MSFIHQKTLSLSVSLSLSLFLSFCFPSVSLSSCLSFFSLSLKPFFKRCILLKLFTVFKISEFKNELSYLICYLPGKKFNRLPVSIFKMKGVNACSANRPDSRVVAAGSNLNWTNKLSNLSESTHRIYHDVDWFLAPRSWVPAKFCHEKGILAKYVCQNASKQICQKGLRNDKQQLFGKIFRGDDWKSVA